MRIAFLCKRRYMGKDVILDRYARLYEIPRQLALLGHEVRGYCLSYRTERGEGEWSEECASGSLNWRSERLSRWLVPGVFTYQSRLARQLEEFGPDVLIAASDIPHLTWGAWIARRLRLPFVADLYDDFETFGQARIPGMVAALRWAVRQADLVLTTSSPLRDFVERRYSLTAPVIAMPSCVDQNLFYLQDRKACRAALGLPDDAPLIGTAGALQPDKGIDLLYRAWEVIRERNSQIRLVLAGSHPPGFRPPADDHVHYLGALPHHCVATLFGALDVGAICIPDTTFGRHCFPQKAYEMLACGLAPVASNVGAIGALLAEYPANLHAAGDADDLAAKILGQVDSRCMPDIAVPDWEEVISAIEPELHKLATNARRR